ncbi:DNA-3-methyladenine glycosylase 2 family protein [Methylophilaceae bacterium]|nr:DNA-3-methyladenine glycosylase 2 family protein [Methylophilaceae bacterium]
MPANLLSGDHQKRCIEGTKFLSSLDSDWNLLISSVGPCKLNLSMELEPYQALIKSVIFQQLRPTSATAIFNRFTQYFDSDFPTAKQIIDTPKNKLKECGLSTKKLSTIIEIASQEENEALENRKGFEIMSDIQIIQKLTRIKGIGEWTVQMLMVFNLGRLDIFPVGDFALKKNYSLFKNIASPINVKDLSKISEEWKPFRSIAAWYLWQYKLKFC